MSERSLRLVQYAAWGVLCGLLARGLYAFGKNAAGAELDILRAHECRPCEREHAEPERCRTGVEPGAVSPRERTGGVR